MGAMVNHPAPGWIEETRIEIKESLNAPQRLFAPVREIPVSNASRINYHHASFQSNFSEFLVSLRS